MVGAGNAALERSEIAFHRVRVNVAPDVLTSRMIDGTVIGKLLADVEILTAFVRHKARLATDLLHDNGPKRLTADFCDMIGTRTPTTLDKRMNNLFASAADVLLVTLLAVLILLFTTHIRRVGFDDLAFAAKWAGMRFDCGHTFSDAVCHEPRCSIRAEAKHSPELMRGYAFLARRHKMSRKQPFVQRDMRALVKRAERGRERFLAAMAFVESRTMALTLEFRGVVHNTAERTDRTVGPAKRLEMLPGSFLVREDRVRQITGEGALTPEFLDLLRRL